MDEIEPGRLYSTRDAAALIPSPYGKTYLPETLLRWVKAGVLKPEYRQAGKRRWVFFWGAELIRFLNASKPPEFNGRSEKDRQRGLERARRLARKHGIPTGENT